MPFGGIFYLNQLISSIQRSIFKKQKSSAKSSVKNIILFILICVNAPILIQLPLLVSDLYKEQSNIGFIINLIFFIITIICFVCDVETRTNITLFLIQLSLLIVVKMHR